MWPSREIHAISVLEYLDCRGDKGGERNLQLAGWDHLGLRELERRLLLLIINQFIIVCLACSRRARQEDPGQQREPRVCFYWV